MGKSSFYSILKNERYTGVYIYDTVRVEGGVPQIIGKELFHIVQERLRTKKNPKAGTGSTATTCSPVSCIVASARPHDWHVRNEQNGRSPLLLRLPDQTHGKDL